MIAPHCGRHRVNDQCQLKSAARLSRKKLRVMTFQNGAMRRFHYLYLSSVFELRSIRSEGCVAVEIAGCPFEGLP
jgi:hypothetical protein